MPSQQNRKNELLDKLIRIADELSSLGMTREEIKAEVNEAINSKEPLFSLNRAWTLCSYYEKNPTKDRR